MAQIARTLSGRWVPLVLFTTPGCAWCQLLLDEQLHPRRKTKLGPRIDWIEINLAAVDNKALAEQYKVTVAPTLIALAPAHLQPQRLIGYSSRDFYGAYLEDLVQEASRRWQSA